jgi:hypothetical protein
MAPRNNSPGLGMGLPVVARLADHLGIRRLAHAAEIRMAFSRSG